MTEVETHKARKAHRCEWCWQRIDEGAEYKRYRYYDGGEAATIKMHPECMGAMQDEAAEWGGDFEWTPGQERPLDRSAVLPAPTFEREEMIHLTQQRTEIANISMTAEEAKTVVMQYITKVVIGDGCYITTEGRLEHWTSYPHGSGTTTDKGEPTPLQLAAWEFMTLAGNHAG